MKLPATATAAPPDLEVRGVSKRFGAHLAVDNLSFNVARGSFFSILGPSGCGKTTLLRMIAGFIRPDGGEIAIGGRSMADVPPNRRPVNMVFQQLALFPMMSVAQNVAFGLARRGVGRAERMRRAAAMLERVGLARRGAASVPTSSPAASASASPSPAAWCSSRRCCCWTNRSARST